MYSDEGSDAPTKPIADLDIITGRMTVHDIFGGVNDWVCVCRLLGTPEIYLLLIALCKSRSVQDALLDSSSPRRLRRFASVIRLPGVGHAVPQQTPAILASAQLSPKLCLITRAKQTI